MATETDATQVVEFDVRTEEMLVNMGPQHPSTHGVLRLVLRTDGEIDWDEQQAVSDAGIEFVEVPFRAPDSLNDEVFDNIRGLLNDGSKKTLFHVTTSSINLVFNENR